MMNLREKYKPTTLSQILKNEIEINKIKNWLNNKKKFNTLLIHGDVGSGKSIITKLILEEFNYNTYHLNYIYDNFDNVDENMICNMLNSKLDDNTNNKIILIDDLESYVSKNDNKLIKSLIKNNKTPMIIVSSNKDLKDIKKMVDCVKIKKLDIYTLINYVKMICNKEKINVEYYLLKSIIENNNKDLRRILNYMNELKNVYKTKNIDVKEFSGYNNVMKNKNSEINIFIETDMLMSKFNGIEICKKIYDEDKILTSIMMHKNYHKHMDENEYDKVLESFAYSNILENIVYDEQKWEYNDVVGLLSCVIPSYFINKYK